LRNRLTVERSFIISRDSTKCYV